MNGAIGRPAVGAYVTSLPVDQTQPIFWSILVSLLALALGGIFGLFQALERLGLDFYASLPIVKTYYQGLTLHGVLLVLVFTFAFSNGFLQLAIMRGLERPLASTFLVTSSVIFLMLGVVLAGWAMLANEATVLFTFYPPLRAHPLFYLGLVLVVISTWFTLANQILTLRGWQRDHPGERIPLVAFIAILTYVMWGIASLGVAVEVLVLLLPWAFGWVPTVDPQLARTLFWFSGHPIVYAWLLPVYVSWYTMVPRQAGGRVYSDPITRLVFLLFLILSIPIGLHHQYTEAGIAPTFKVVQGILTFAVFFPSMITAFSVMASLEGAGRARGGHGLLGWIPRLPWSDPSVAAQLLAMVVFTLGGVTGLINASLTVNLVVHNTAFVPGHFHLTVGTAVALSILGISYWLVPYLTGRALWARRLALLQAWLWAIGVLLFARGQIAGGLAAMPRRTAIGVAPYTAQMASWGLDNWLTAIGGIIMVVSGLLFFVVIVGTLLGLGGRAEVEMPLADSAPRAERVWPMLDRWGVWVAATVALIILSYGPFFATYLPMLNATSPGFRLW